MARVKVNLFGGTGKSRFASVNGQRSINMYAHQPSPGGSELVMLPCPGLVQHRDYRRSAPVRGLLSAGGELYAVVGGRFFAGGVDKGALSTTSGPVSMVWNGYQVLITDGTHGYVFDPLALTFSQAPDVDFPAKPGPAAYQDLYAIVPQLGTDKFYISGINDFSTWDGLEFGRAQGNPDNVVAAISDHRELWLFGEQSSEVYANTGNADFPFERIGGTYQEVGCAAGYSLAKLDNTIFWLGQTDHGRGLVYRANGYTPQVVSTREVEDQIAGLARIEDAIGWALTWSGHPQYWLTFPSADLTLVFDVVTELWHERKSFGMGRHRANCYAFHAGKHLVGDCQAGVAYEMSADASDEAGQPLERVRRSQVLSQDQLRMFHDSVEVVFEVGAGGGQGDPQVMLRWSDDDGRTWSNEHWRGLGRQGEYGRRAVWRRLGASRKRIYELSMADGAPLVMAGAWLTADQGAW